MKQEGKYTIVQKKHQDCDEVSNIIVSNIYIYIKYDVSILINWVPKTTDATLLRILRELGSCLLMLHEFSSVF